MAASDMQDALLNLVAELFKRVFVRPDGMSVRDAKPSIAVVRRLAVNDPALPSMLRRIYGHRRSREHVVT
jgi:hypothetical protein